MKQQIRDMAEAVGLAMEETNPIDGRARTGRMWAVETESGEVLGECTPHDTIALVTARAAIRALSQETKLEIPHNSVALFFKRCPEEGSELDFQLATHGKDLLCVISDLLSEIYPVVTKGWIECDRRTNQVLEAVQKRVWELAEEHGVSNLMEEWGVGGGGLECRLIPPHVDHEHDFYFDKPPEGYLVKPNGDIVQVVADPMEDQPRRLEERIVGFVEYLTRRESWWGYCAGADRWTEVCDDIVTAVRAVVTLHEGDAE